MPWHQNRFVVIGTNDFAGHFAGGKVYRNTIHIASFPEIVNSFYFVTILWIYIITCVVVHNDYQLIVINKAGKRRIIGHAATGGKIAAVIRREKNSGAAVGTAGANRVWTGDGG